MIGKSSSRLLQRQHSAGAYATTFRTLGNAATTQVIAAFDNGAGSPVLVVPTEITVFADMTAALAAVAAHVRLTRASAVSAGTVITKTLTDTAMASASQVVVRGATASDGGTATAITATIGTTIRQALLPRMQTAVGYVSQSQGPLYADRSDMDGIVLRAGEALAIQVVAAVGTSNPATNHYLVNLAWEEYQ